jgi:hypothetical protein
MDFLSRNDSILVSLGIYNVQGMARVPRLVTKKKGRMKRHKRYNGSVMLTLMNFSSYEGIS